MKKYLYIFLVLGCVITAKAQNKLFEAIEAGNLEGVKAALNDAISPNSTVEIQHKGIKYDNFSPLLCAVINQNTQIVEELLRRKAKANISTSAENMFYCDGKCEAKVSNLTPLIQASQQGNIEIIKLLVRGKADLDKLMRIKFINKKCCDNYHTVHEGEEVNWSATELYVGPQRQAKDKETLTLLKRARYSEWAKEKIR